MAVVKLGKPVKSNLGGDNGAMAYIINPAKTDGGRLVSSNYERTGTDYDALADPMLEDNENSPKRHPEEQPSGVPHQAELQSRRPRDTGEGARARCGVRTPHHQ